MSSTTPGEGGNTDGKEAPCQIEDQQQLTDTSKEPETVAQTAADVILQHQLDTNRFLRRSLQERNRQMQAIHGRRLLAADEADGLHNQWDIGDADDNIKRVINPFLVYENLPHQTASSSTQPQPPLAPGIVTSEVKPAGKQTGRSKPSTRLEQRKQEGIGELKDTNIQLQNKNDELSEMVEEKYRRIQSIKLKATNQRQLEAANTKLEQQLRDAQENIHHMAIQFNALGDESLQWKLMQENKVKELVNVVHTLEQTFVNSESQKSDMQKYMISLKNQDRALREELESCKIKLETTRKDHEKQIQSTQEREQTEVTEKLKDARTEIKQLKIKLQTAEDSNSNTIAQLKQTSAALEHVKSNYIRNQEIEAKLQEDMISLRNQDKNLRQELESYKIKLAKTRKDHEKQLQSTQDQLDKTKQELKELQNSLRHGGLEREQLPSQDVHGLQKRLAKAETNEKLLESQLDQVRKELRDRNIELEDAKTSKLMDQRLTDNNPKISDLSDKNRPTKLAERYSELYDNQWTDAFEDLDKIYRDEKKTIATLLVILTETATFCRKEAKGQMENLRKVLILETTLTASRGQDVPDVITKQLKYSRKTMAEKAEKHLVETYIQRLQQLTSASARDALRVETFLREAFTLCWLMSIQDPPVVFDRLIQHGEKFNIELYRSYTKAGPLVDFPVLPTMFLQEDGPVLYKGWAQGCNK